MMEQERSSPSARCIRKFASGCVFWIGMALIALMAIPAGVLAGLISLLVRLTGFLTDWIEGD